MLQGDEATLTLGEQGWQCLKDDMAQPTPESARLSLPASSVIAFNLADDLLGERLSDGQASELLPGVTMPATIASMSLTCTPAHVEDHHLGACNRLLRGASKLWTVIPSAFVRSGHVITQWSGTGRRRAAVGAGCKGATLVDLVRQKEGPEGIVKLATKNLRPIFSQQELKDLDATMVLQQPGDLVVTSPVCLLS